MRQAHHADLDEPLNDDLDDEPDGQPIRPMLVSQNPSGALARRDRAATLADQAARRVPYLATTATAATGFGAWKLAEAAATNGQPALSGAIVLGTCVATGVGLPMLRLRLCDRTTRDGTVQRIPHGHRRRWWVAGGAATLWIDAMALGAANVIGPDGMAAILLGGAAALSARWMRDHDIELPTDTPVLTAVQPPVEIEAAPEPPKRFPAPPPPDKGDLIKIDWDAEVARGENPIAPGSALGDDRVDLTHGYQWVVQLPRSGNVTATQLCHRAEDVALKLGYRKTHVLLEPLQGDDEREDRALLTVVTKDVLKDKVPYLGPRSLPDGRIPLGMFADGSGTPYWRTMDDTGPLGGMVVGGTGSGKSELLAKLGMAMRKTGKWIVVFGDGDEQGRSAALLKRVCYDFAKGAAEVMAQLEAMEAWFNVRGKTMGKYTVMDGLPVPITDPARQEPAGKLMPCLRVPGWVWILDEFYLLAKALGQDFVLRVGDLKRAMRKRGGTIIVGTQSGTVGDFGGDDVLHGQLKQDNVVLLRTLNSDDQYAVAADFLCDPTTLPDGGGYGFVNGPPDGRKQMFRGEYDEPQNMARWVHDLPEYRPDLPSARVYAYRRPPTPADPIADYEEAVRDEADILARIERGERLPWEDQPEIASEPPVGLVGGDGVAAPDNVTQRAEWSMGGVEIAQPRLGPMFGGGEASDLAPEPRRPLNGSERLVLNRLVAARCPIRNQQIIADTGLSESVVSRALTGLTARGYATRHGHGLHEVTAAGRVGQCPPTSTDTSPEKT